ncbi:hypothetical protein ACS0TY_007400 [Phlomoides rotata]
MVDHLFTTATIFSVCKCHVQCINVMSSLATIVRVHQSQVQSVNIVCSLTKIVGDGWSLVCSL